MAGKCEECGCVCTKCTKNNEKHSDMHLHAEIENLRQRLIERDSHIVTMETQFLSEADKFPNGELASTKEELHIWQEKYSRLWEAHKRVQKVNQNLEDKLLRIVDKCETEKGAFAKDIATLSHRLADANYTIHRLTQDNEKYRNDVNLAIQLLQCKPSNFVGQKYDNLPSEVQAKVRTYVAQKRRSSDVSPPDVKSITVPISTFPPTAMVYNITKANPEKHSDDESDDSKPPVDVVSAAIMAKVLEDRERERIFAKHCDTCTCHRTILMIDSESQTCLDRRLCDQLENSELSGKIYDATNGPNSQAVESMSNGQNYRRNETKMNNFELGLNDNLDGSPKAITSGDSRLAGHRSAGMVQKHASKQKMNQINRPIINKIKQTRLTKKNDADSSAGNRVNDVSKVSQVSAKDHKNEVDIINDRIWKSGWNSHSSSTTDAVGSGKRSSDTQIDVINDRVWRNDANPNNNNKTQMTLVEVTNSVNLTDASIQKTATSPSFSSDSAVISTSNQSSSSSDALRDKRPRNNSKWKDRSAGPRNCFMRVQPGTKNILLDNVGHYQTVLYTSGTNRPNTALVHVAKSTRSGRSISTSSEENSPMVQSNDSNQLQRVAEWVKSVGENEAKIPNARRDKREAAPLIPTKEETLVKIDTEENTKTALLENNLEEIVVEKPLDNPFSDDSSRIDEISSTSLHGQDGVTEDLISFENPQDKSTEDLSRTNDPNYEVKITKEMEEIYLKLTASLDPVSLRLAGPNNADITIENYRKDHRRINGQKLQDKPK